VRKSRALKGKDYFLADDMEKNRQQSGQPGQQKKGGQGQNNEENENLDRQRRAS